MVPLAAVAVAVVVPAVLGSMGAAGTRDLHTRWNS